MKSIFSITRNKLEDYFLDKGEKKFKATQVFEWIYRKGVRSFDEMTNLKKETIDMLKEDFSFNEIKIVRKEEDELVKKYLFELSDNEHIEAVLMKHDYGNSVCVSSQIGCNMGCAFCESGRLKKVRNLEAGEIVEQILAIEEDAKIRLSSVVVMGIGEPFDNYDNLIEFLKIINDPHGLAIGARHITVSTSGIVPKILEFADFPLQINLAISLHAPNDELRSRLMKINKVYSIDALMDAIDYYYKKTNRRITIEYVMLNNVNDTVECAKQLVSLLRGKNVYVNLIPYNETSHFEFSKSTEARRKEFFDLLHKAGITVTVRREFGGNIDAACGQLRANEVER